MKETIINREGERERFHGEETTNNLDGEVLTAVRRLIGRLTDELRLGFTVDNEFRVGLSPRISREFVFAPLGYALRFFIAFNLSCFF